jgi:hypothetical protein
MAYINDQESLAGGRPALQKLLMLKEVSETLRKLSLQEKFLELGGCRVLANWLDLLPDGSYPNYNLSLGILNCIASLKFTEIG